jgi:hypothetical protein
MSLRISTLSYGKPNELWTTGALRAVYTDAKVSSMPLYFLKNTAVISGTENAATAGGLGHRVVDLLPLVFKKEDEPAQMRGR